MHDVTEICTLQASRFWAGASDSDEEEDKGTTSEEESTDDSSSSDSENEQKKGPSRQDPSSPRALHLLCSLFYTP